MVTSPQSQSSLHITFGSSLMISTDRFGSWQFFCAFPGLLRSLTDPLDPIWRTVGSIHVWKCAYGQTYPLSRWYICQMFVRYRVQILEADLAAQLQHSFFYSESREWLHPEHKSNLPVLKTSRHAHIKLNGKFVIPGDRSLCVWSFVWPCDCVF